MNADRVLSSQLDAAYGARRPDGATGLTAPPGAAQRTGVAFGGAPERGRPQTRPSADRIRSASAPRGSRGETAGFNDFHEHAFGCQPVHLLSAAPDRRGVGPA
jgi:hypothetical protein